MKRYYIEMTDRDYNKPYVIQSRWFDTKEQALEWLNTTIDYCDLIICLMSADFDNESEEYEIKFEKYLTWEDTDL